MTDYIRVYLAGSFNYFDNSLIECLREMKERHKIICEKYNIFDVGIYAHNFLLQCIEGPAEKVRLAILYFIKNHPFCSFKILFSKTLFAPVLKESSFNYASQEILQFFQHKQIKNFSLLLLTYKDLTQLFPMINNIIKFEPKQDLFWYMF
jgi:hypothetical protein